MSQCVKYIVALIRAEDGQILTIPPTVTFGPPARGPD
jgi:hypothetical protein